MLEQHTARKIGLNSASLSFFNMNFSESTDEKQIQSLPHQSDFEFRVELDGGVPHQSRVRV